MRKRGYYFLLASVVILAIALMNMFAFAKRTREISPLQIDAIAVGIVVTGFCIFMTAVIGFVLGFSRGNGLMLEPEELIPNKLFKIMGMDAIAYETIISIEVGTKRKRCTYPSSVAPTGATHLRVAVDDSGTSRFEFVKVTPEVVEIV